jgi:two-component system, probable response regulator PhcQ
MTGYDYQKYAVLYVDDELQSLKYFPKLFGDNLRCLTASSVAQAREIIAKEGDAIGVVISDQRMPGESGVDLLSWLRGSRPQIVRILTTAYSDLDSAIEAVNSGAIFRYVVKPWDDRDLRGVLLRAMEFHLVQRERDGLLREKLAVLQRIVVMDRVRSFAVLAAGLANRIKNPMLALKTFLEHAPARAAADHEDPHVQWGDLWAMAEGESQRILELVQEVVRKTVEPDYRFKPGVRLADALAPAMARARATLGDDASLTVAPDVPAISADETMVPHLFEILVQRMIALDLTGGAIAISADNNATVWGRPAVKVRLRAGGREWSAKNLAGLFSVLSPGTGPAASEMDLLAAFFIAYHHAGNLTVHLKGPAGPGFEVLLPLDPASAGELPLERDWVESIFAFPEP